MTTTMPGTRAGAASTRNNATVLGAQAATGATVMFAHGFGCDQTMWDRTAPGFAAARQVLLFDHVGAGGSDLTAYDARKYRSLHGYADDVIELLDEVDVGPVAYVGHSVGAMIGLLASIRRPDLFCCVVLLGASARYLDDDGYRGGFSRTEIDQMFEAMESNYLGWSQSLAPVAMGNADRPQLADELAQSFARTQSRIAVEFARAIFLSDHRADLDHVSVPTLVVQATDDPMVSSAACNYLHRAIPGSRLAQLEATGHYPHVSGPDETARAIHRFITDVEG